MQHFNYGLIYLREENAGVFRRYSIESRLNSRFKIQGIGITFFRKWGRFLCMKFSAKIIAALLVCRVVRSAREQTSPSRSTWRRPLKNTSKPKHNLKINLPVIAARFIFPFRKSVLLQVVAGLRVTLDHDDNYSLLPCEPSRCITDFYITGPRPSRCGRRGTETKKQRKVNE